MAYRIELSPSAARQLKRIDRRLLPRIAEKINSLAIEPRPHGVEKLSAQHDLYRVRVGDYRIVYGVEDRSVLVAILRVGNRSEVYQRIRDSDLDFLRTLLGD